MIHLLWGKIGREADGAIGPQRLDAPDAIPGDEGRRVWLGGHTRLTGAAGDWALPPGVVEGAQRRKVLLVLEEPLAVCPSPWHVRVKNLWWLLLLSLSALGYHRTPSCPPQANGLTMPIIVLPRGIRHQGRVDRKALLDRVELRGGGRGDGKYVGVGKRSAGVYVLSAFPISRHVLVLLSQNEACQTE
eukprot:465906-Rhodomonas_salina.2